MRYRSILVIALSAALTAVSTAQLSIEFGPASPVHAGSTSTSFLRGAQLVGGATADVVDWTYATSTIRIWDLGVNPTFTTPAVTLTVAVSIHDVAVGDVDTDGDQDIVAVDQSGEVRVFLNTNGSFTSAALPIAAVGNATIRDVNGDSRPDITAGRSVLLGQGGGGFQPLALPLPADPGDRELLPADIDGDGDVDFVLLRVSFPVGAQGVVAHVIRNDGGGVYSLQAPTIINTTVAIFRGDVVDLNLDGRDEIILNNGLNTQAFTQIQIIEGSPAATLSERQLIRLPASTRYGQSQVVDINGDGYRDFVATVNDNFDVVVGGYTPVILLNDGAGNLVPNQGLGFGSSFGVLRLGMGLVAGQFDVDPAVDCITVAAAFPSPQGIVPALMKSSIVSPGAAPVTTLALAPSTSSLVAQNQTRSFNHLIYSVSAGGIVPLRGLWTQSSITNNQTTAAIVGGASAIAPSAANGVINVEVSTGPTLGRFDLTVNSYLGPQSVSSFAVGGQFLSQTGQNQSTLAGSPFAAPLEVVIGDVFGAPLGGVVVFVSTSTIPQLVAIQTGMHQTDANGRLSLPVSALSMQGGTFVSYTVAGLGGVSFPLIIQTQLNPFSGSDQVAPVGSPYPNPIVVRAVDPMGNPIVNVPVTFSGAGITFTSATQVMTDGLGFASVTGIASVAGSWSVFASSPIGTASAPVFNRGLRRLPTGSTGVTLRYDHEHGGVPLILAVDAPLAAPVPTPFGQVHTSILAPSTTLFLIDGLGLVGQYNPTAITNAGGFYSISAFIGPIPLGITLVSQVYAVDNAQPFPANFQISNPVTLNL